MSNMYLKASDWVKMSIFISYKYKAFLCIFSMPYWHDAIYPNHLEKEPFFQLVTPIHSLLLFIRIFGLFIHIG